MFYQNNDQPDDLACKVFISNLPYLKSGVELGADNKTDNKETYKGKLQRHIEEITGEEVEDLHVVKQDHNQPEKSNRIRGIGFVTLKTPAAAQKLIAQKESKFSGPQDDTERTIYFAPSKPKASKPFRSYRN